MTTRICLTADVDASRLRAYLADPAHRPAWQSSLRAVEGVVAGPDGTGGVGTRWIDVTVVPGIRPRMYTTASERLRWAEAGDFGPFSATLVLDFVPLSASRCRVEAEFAVVGVPVLGRVLTLTARPAVTADLRRAIALAGG